MPTGQNARPPPFQIKALPKFHKQSRGKLKRLLLQPSITKLILAAAVFPRPPSSNFGATSQPEVLADGHRSATVNFVGDEVTRPTSNPGI